MECFWRPFCGGIFHTSQIIQCVKFTHGSCLQALAVSLWACSKPPLTHRKPFYIPFYRIQSYSIFWPHLNKFSQVLLGCQMQTTNATSHQVITTHNLMLTCFPPEYEMWPHWMTVHQELKTLDGFTQRRWEHRSLLASRQTVQTLFVITIQSQTLLVMFSLCLSSEYIDKGLDIFCFWFVCKSIIYTS